MKISIWGDVHLEFSDFEVSNPQHADTLILPGDIMIAEYLYEYLPDHVNANGNPGDKQKLAERFRRFLAACSREFKHVIFIPGNHEFYHGKFHLGLRYLRTECARYDNIHFLENGTVELDGVTFIGATLWTDLNKGDPFTNVMIRDLMMDYSRIRNDKLDFTKLKPRDTMDRHYRTMDYFKIVLDHLRDQDSAGPIVIVTHHAPCSRSLNPAYVSQKEMNGGYYSDLSEFILDHPEIALWVSGHTHYCVDYAIGTTRIVSNSRGYQSNNGKEYTGFEPNMVVEV